MCAEGLHFSAFYSSAIGLQGSKLTFSQLAQWAGGCHFGCPYKSCNCPNILRNALSPDTTTTVIARLGARVWDDAVYEC